MVKIFEVENQLDKLNWFSMEDKWTNSYPLIEHIGKSIGATHWANWGQIGVPWSDEMIGGSGTYMLRTPDGHAMLDASTMYSKGKPSHIGLSQISIENPSSGLGTKIMNAIKQYADAKGVGVVVYKVTNKPFFDRFNWLTIDKYKDAYYYSPSQISDLNESKNTIENIIKIAQNIFGTDNLSSGNCGNFALALGKILKEKGLNPKLAFTFREVDDLTSTEISNQGTQTIGTSVSTETIDDVINAETDIYHIILKVNGQYYDGTGKTNTDELLDMVADQYDDYYPGFFDNIELNDPAMLKLIRTETNCQIPMQTFYQKIKEKI